MKAILSKLGTALLIIIVAPVLIVGLLPIILWFVLLDILSKLFIRLRKDPKRMSLKRHRIYSNNEYPEGGDGVGEYFDRYLTVIKKDCSIKTDTVVIDKSLDDTEDAYLVTLSATLNKNHGTAMIKMEAAGFSNDDLFTATQDGDIPPYLEVVYRQPDGPRTVFDVSGYDSLEFLIASLNNGQRLSRAGQIWTKLKDDLWIVNYSVKKSDRSDRIGRDYGYRRTFSDAKARQYFFDKKRIPHELL